MKNKITFSTAKPLGFYSQSLQDKLYSVLGNGERLTLEDIWRVSMACADAFRTYSEHIDYDETYGFWDGIVHSGIEADYWESGPDGKCSEAYQSLTTDGFSLDRIDHQLNIEEWLALNRWSSELAEIRLRDLKRFQRSQKSA
ncbi:hypothetical protein NG799_27700 [Laspinema sp. D1]|uniref:Uncharacterized protein n=1 Tax=Laspinema palackyanum D2a TaxID=2953684 RepID=A0ABT2MZB6_9CYAN|nr:hypothetical protein [Laspinema sp. D2a]